MLHLFGFVVSSTSLLIFAGVGLALSLTTALIGVLATATAIVHLTFMVAVSWTVYGPASTMTDSTRAISFSIIAALIFERLVLRSTPLLLRVQTKATHLSGMASKSVRLESFANRLREPRFADMKRPASNIKSTPV